jgi:glutamine cyclotransferase
MAGLGTDFREVELTDSQFKAAEVTNSTAFVDVTKRLKQAFDAYLLYQGLTFLGGKYYDKVGAEISSAETIRLNELSNAKSAAEAAEKTKQLGMMLEAAPVTP